MDKKTEQHLVRWIGKYAIVEPGEDSFQLFRLISEFVNNHPKVIYEGAMGWTDIRRIAEGAQYNPFQA